MNKLPKYIARFLLITLLLLAGSVAFSDEGGEEKPKAPPPKPTPDSAISVVLALPEVKSWKAWMDSQNYTLEVWGESIRQVNGDPYWEVAVAEKTGDEDGDTRVWAYFCVNQSSKDVLVEWEDKAQGDTVYYPYDKWKKSCHPLSNSPGKC